MPAEGGILQSASVTNFSIWTKVSIYGNPSIVEQTQSSNSNIGSIETKEHYCSLVSILPMLLFDNSLFDIRGITLLLTIFSIQK